MGGDLSGTASNAQIVANAVGTTEIANSAVTDAKIAGMSSSKLSGALPAIDGSALTNLPAGGKVLQVVTTSTTTKTVLSAGSAGQTIFYDIAGLSLAITPTSTSSKILVTATVSFSNNYTGYNAYLGLYRSSTRINTGQADAVMRSYTGNQILTSTFSALDSPNTISSTTYSVKGCNSGGSGWPTYINRSLSDHGWELDMVSTITLTEISV